VALESKVPFLNIENCNQGAILDPITIWAIPYGSVTTSVPIMHSLTKCPTCIVFEVENKGEGG
jgi:hypothetical protein